MSLPAAALRKMLEAGLSLEQAVDIAEAWEEGTATSRDFGDTASKKRARDAARMREKREKERLSRDVAATVAGDVAPSCAQVVTLTSSLRSEGTQEANASFVDASNDAKTPAEPEKPKTKPPKSIRGTRLPEDWEPSVAEVELARSEGLTDEEISRAALEFRNYWCSRSRDATKLSWPKTWHNRVLDLADRKRRDGARMAAAATSAGGGGRRGTTFADLYVRRHGTA